MVARKRGKAVKPQPGVGDELDREIDAARSEKRPIRGFSNEDQISLKSGAMAVKFNPVTGAMIGVGPGKDKPRPSDGFAHAHAAASQAEPEEGGDSAIPEMPSASADPRARLNAVRTKHPDYFPEYEMWVLQRLLQRSMTNDMIGYLMGCSTRTVAYKIKKLRAMQADMMRHFDTAQFMGDAHAFYAEQRGRLLRISEKANIKVHEQIAAIQAAGNMQNAHIAFLKATGTLAERPFEAAPADKDARREGKGLFFDITTAMLKGGDGAVEAVLEEFERGGTEETDEPKIRLF